MAVYVCCCPVADCEQLHRPGQPQGQRQRLHHSSSRCCMFERCVPACAADCVLKILHMLPPVACSWPHPSRVRASSKHPKQHPG